MKKGWEIKNLGELCRFIDYRGKTPEKTTSGLRLITAKNVKMGYLQETPMEYVSPESYDSWMTRGIPKLGDVLFTTEAPLANVAQLDTDKKVVFAQRIIVLQPLANNLDRTFLKYLLLSDAVQNRILEQGTGATVQGIKARLLKTILIEFPTLPEQQRIVKILDLAFAGIATAQANAAKNLQNARDLFASHLNEVFTHRGAGWVETALDDVCGFVRGPFGGSLKKSIFVADGFAVYEQQHAIYDQFDDVRYFIAELKFKEMKRFEILPGDLIMSCSGTMGRVAIVPKKIKRGIINQALLKLTPSPKILNTFLKLWMESAAFQDALKEYSGGAAIQNVASVKVLKEIKVPLPPFLEQKKVVEKLDAMLSETRRLAAIYQRKQAALSELKQSLLHRAFAGEL